MTTITNKSIDDFKEIKNEIIKDMIEKSIEIINTSTNIIKNLHLDNKGDFYLSKFISNSVYIKIHSYLCESIGALFAKFYKENLKYDISEKKLKKFKTIHLDTIYGEIQKIALAKDKVQLGDKFPKLYSFNEERNDEAHSTSNWGNKKNIEEWLVILNEFTNFIIIIEEIMSISKIDLCWEELLKPKNKTA